MSRVPSVSAIVAAALSIGCSLAAPPVGAAPVNYVCDPQMTEVVFRFNHGGYVQRSGTFTEFTCDLVFDDDELSASNLKVTIKAASVSTGIKALDDELKGPDFFDAAGHPDITFVSTAIKKRGRKAATVVGDLTIKDTKVPLSLKVKLNKKGEHPAGVMFDAYKGKWAGFSAEGKLKRSELGLDKFNAIVADKVLLTINTEMKER